MSVKGSPHARFRRAVETGNPTLVIAAAAELPRVDLPDALAIVLVLLDGRSPRFDRAAVRWHGRHCLESPGLSLPEAGVVLSALRALGGEHGTAAAEALASVFFSLEQEELGRVVARWAARHDG